MGYANQYVFFPNENNKEIELEAKLIAKIAKASAKEDVRVFIPNITKQEREVYSHYLKLVQECKDADFVFDKEGVVKKSCKDSKKLFFTNNYKRLLGNDLYYGAFFWNKSRPNIVFIKQRLEQNKVVLSKEYTQYIEELNGLR